MAAHDDTVSLKQLLDHACEACDLVRDRCREDLDTDRVLSLALIQLMQILGEAARRVSQEAQEENPTIPWGQVIALRNRLIHGYDSINYDIMWQILTTDLPPLVTELSRIIDARNA